MAKKVDVSEFQTFSQISDRLDVIVDAVRDKDTSLERSLDLFDEAIALGSKAVDMVDATDFSPEEEAQLAQAAAGAGQDAAAIGEASAAPEAPEGSAE